MATAPVQEVPDNISTTIELAPEGRAFGLKSPNRYRPPRANFAGGGTA
jgi:hypothetical protein